MSVAVTILPRGFSGSKTCTFLARLFNVICTILPQGIKKLYFFANTAHTCPYAAVMIALFHNVYYDNSNIFHLHSGLNR